MKSQNNTDIIWMDDAKTAGRKLAKLLAKAAQRTKGISFEALEKCLEEEWSGLSKDASGLKPFLDAINRRVPEIREDLEEVVAILERYKNQAPELFGPYHNLSHWLEVNGMHAEAMSTMSAELMPYIKKIAPVFIEEVAPYTPLFKAVFGRLIRAFSKGLRADAKAALDELFPSLSLTAAKTVDFAEKYTPRQLFEWSARFVDVAQLYTVMQKKRPRYPFGVYVAVFLELPSSASYAVAWMLHLRYWIEKEDPVAYFKRNVWQRANELSHNGRQSLGKFADDPSHWEKERQSAQVLSDAQSHNQLDPEEAIIQREELHTIEQLEGELDRIVQECFAVRGKITEAERAYGKQRLLGVKHADVVKSLGLDKDKSVYLNTRFARTKKAMQAALGDLKSGR